MCFCVFFFFKQKTAYEMRISDWSSDVCSSDLMPVEVDGVVYAAAGYSVIHAVDVRSGKLLWKYDPHVGIRKMRMAWGIRGLTYWNGKIYAGVQDGRLFALDAKTGALEIGRAHV